MSLTPATQCQCCDTTEGLIHYHQNTAYHDEASNWVTLCPPCKEQNDEHWRSMWAEYRAGCL